MNANLLCSNFIYFPSKKALRDSFPELLRSVFFHSIYYIVYKYAVHQ